MLIKTKWPNRVAVLHIFAEFGCFIKLILRLEYLSGWNISTIELHYCIRIKYLCIILLIYQTNDLN